MPESITLASGVQIVSLPYAAKIAGVAERTIRTWEQVGHLPQSVKVGRTRYYRRPDVLAAEAKTRSTDPTRKRLRGLLANVDPVGHTSF